MNIRISQSVMLGSRRDSLDFEVEEADPTAMDQLLTCFERMCTEDTPVSESETLLASEVKDQW